jgi:type I restriction-modification system DNA methylase subunit
MSKGFDLHRGKETWKQLAEIHQFGYSAATIFSDFVDTCLLSLLSLTENMQSPNILEKLQQNKLTGTYEAQYLQMVGKYQENHTANKGRRPIDFMVNAWRTLVRETLEFQQDALGEIFMANVGFGEHGQFFTPTHVSDMMAQMVYSSKSTQQETVCDPCCGSGRFFLSV